MLVAQKLRYNSVCSNLVRLIVVWDIYLVVGRGMSTVWLQQTLLQKVNALVDESPMTIESFKGANMKLTHC